MARWLRLLAERIRRDYISTSLGHAARLNGLHRNEAGELCRILRECFDERWDAMVVVTAPESEYEVALDVAIERRNDKTKSRLFLVPVELTAEAAASLADTDRHEITEYLRPIVNELLRKLPVDQREILREAMKRTPHSARLEYLCGLPESPSLIDCGRGLWRLGLIPDLSPAAARLIENRACVEKLTDPRKGGGSIRQRVGATGLAEPKVVETLVRLLREAGGHGLQVWLRRIAEEPELGLTFDRWKFPDRAKVNLQAIEVNSFRDPKKNKAYSWSGLTLEDDTLKVSTSEAKTRVTVRWTTEPESPTGDPLYEVSLQTSEPQPVPLLAETQKHKAGRTQSWTFHPSEVEGIETGSLRVKVIVRSYSEERKEAIAGESDEFLLVSGPVDTPSTSVFPVTRSLPDFLLERAAMTKSIPELTQCVIEPGSGIKVELDERQRRRILLNPVLQAAERKILEDPAKAGAIALQLSPEVRWTPGDLQWNLREIDLQSLVGSVEWWRIRKRLFVEIASKREDRGVLEACELSDFAEDILFYCRGYANMLEGVLEGPEGQHGSSEILAALVCLDTVQIWEERGSDGGNAREIVAALVAPLHPLRLLWHLAHEALIREWIRQSTDRSLKATLPKPAIALQIDGGNFPGYLAEGKALLYHIDSPYFHWPLYVSAEEEDPHRVAALVRWGLGLGTLERLTIGQEVAAEELAKRLRDYADLHPYVRTLKLNAVNAGDGKLLIKALNALDEMTQQGFEADEVEQTPAEDRAYEVRLYGPKPVHQIGSFLDECATQRRRGQGLPEKLDRLFRPGDNFLRPHLFWAKRELREIEEDNSKSCEEAHISFVTEYFRPQPDLIREEAANIENTISTYGLQTDLTSMFIADEKGFGWIRTVQVPDSGRITPHPAGRQFTKELLRLHRLSLKAVARLRGGHDDTWPATRVSVEAKQFKLFSRLHEASDWVLTVDRNLGVEIFDSPTNTPLELGNNARRYLIDYTPQQVGAAGQQLMISTSWVEEVSSLLRETLREMLISPTDLACEEVLRLLKSISGRLVMRVARYPEVAKEAVSLAVVREVLRGEGMLSGAFLVPVDDHFPIFGPSAQPKVRTEARRPDLLLVRPRLDKKATLQIDLIEVKYRRHRYMAYDRGLWSDMLEATTAGKQALASAFFPSQAGVQLDLPIRRRQLRAVLAFYARRAVRHGLLDPETGERFLQWFDNLQREDLSLQVEQRGCVYCPELNFETEEHEHGELKVSLIGREALPRYTSLSSTEPASVPQSYSVEERPVSQPQVTAQQQLIRESQAAVLSVPSAVHPGKPEGVSAELGRTRAELEILLGNEVQSEAPVYFRPSLRGNPHGLIVGIPGMGKTTAVLNICRELAKTGVFPFLIDFHGDLARGLQSDSGGQPCAVLDAAGGLPFNPLEIDEARRREDRGWVVHLFEVAEILANIYPSFGELQVGALRDTLRQCYEATGFGARPREATAPKLCEFWQCLQQKAEEARDVRKITTRLDSIFQLELFREDAGTSFVLADLLSQVTVLDLHRIGLEENQRVAASFFLQRLYRDMFNHAETPGLRNAVVFDEAHRVAKLTLIPKMMQECRKYGILLILSSQRVEDFDQGVLDSAGNQLYLRVNHPDARRLSAYLAAGNRVGDLTQRLQNLHKYHALFRSEEYQPFVHVRLATPQGG